MLTLDSGACNVIPFSALGDPKAVREGSRRYIRLPSGKIARVIALNGVWITEIGMFEYTLQTLPPVTGLPEGTEVFVSDCNGNIARLINGAWRYISPFTVAWASRPAADAVPVGTELQVTDYANQKWISDGASWRPAQGRVVIKQLFGSLATPIATIAAASAGFFSIPGGSPKIPAGMIVPNSRVVGHIETRKEGAASNFVLGFRLGTQQNDGSMMAVSYGPSGAGESNITTAANFGASQTSFTSSQTISPYATSYSAGNNQTDKSYLVNTAADMNVLVDISNGNAADTYKLIHLAVWLEA